MSFNFDNDKLSDHLAVMYSIINQLTILELLDDQNKMAVLIKSVKDVTQFQSALEVLSVVSTTFKGMVFLLLETCRIIVETSNRDSYGDTSPS